MRHFKTLLVICLCLGFSACLEPSYASSFKPGLSCFTERSPVILQKHTLENGLEVEVLDLTGDGKPDAAVYTPSGAGLSLFYELDIDGDQEPDLLYIDTKRDGKCESIKLYRDYNSPGDAHGPENKGA